MRLTTKTSGRDDRDRPHERQGLAGRGYELLGRKVQLALQGLGQAGLAQRTVLAVGRVAKLSVKITNASPGWSSYPNCSNSASGLSPKPSEFG